MFSSKCSIVPMTKTHTKLEEQHLPPEFEGWACCWAPGCALRLGWALRSLHFHVTVCVTWCLTVCLLSTYLPSESPIQSPVQAGLPCWGCVSRVIPKEWQPFSGNPCDDTCYFKMLSLMLGPIACTSLISPQLSWDTRARCCPSSIPSSYFQEVTVILRVLQLSWGTNNEAVA